jgi:hypothetical protein
MQAGRCVTYIVLRQEAVSSVRITNVCCEQSAELNHSSKEEFAKTVEEVERKFA